ncbi:MULTISPECIES: GTP pyrophosphokinase [unclassified Bradyrhizobium]|uniref:GTP pyrophosphokinase n=1 Tax=unclassified Bradyrhizobium TaxID=2631580 RepID=UPI00211F44B4|nr:MULTISPECIES: (p)ppGpp synthetase [unclassified Bradyrhizobium]MDD1537444.1 (p)ppGpp synthetase [Bradyrhizobium sp. WBOS8]MDD1585565.1 (p)ppGpp synthetase [Bradyrhizobium sp. WBOS4]UUO46709.1 (p)ppGpp synthetase [Bradyrhizobium sp. WBOS04]UUO59480.1 (p)ppGpp synthetase [Bradyrhizobium sp. WBOS08]
MDSETLLLPPEIGLSSEGQSQLFETKKNEFKEYFAGNSQLFVAAEKAFRNLIAQLTDTEDFEQPKVTSRIKDRDECIKKFSLKYRNEAEKKDDYHIKDYITDQIGVRVICLYETDIPKIEHIVRNNFDIVSVTDKTQVLLSDVRSFGYKGLHFDIKLKRDRLALPEYSRFDGVCVELQLRSIVQDAWSEVEHKLRYKKQSPPSLQRRIIRLAALFELADQEFSALNAETEVALIEATAREDAGVPVLQDAALDAFSFLAMMKKFHPKYRFDDEAIDGFVDEIKSMDKSFSLGSLKEAISKYRNHVWDFKQDQRKKDININPFTEIRHVLYAYDKKKFEDMLYPQQRETFVHWLAHNNIKIWN